MMVAEKKSFQTIFWRGGAVVMLDQRFLPREETYNEYRDIEGLAEAIESMVIRGAPAIGVAAAYGMALAAHISTGDAQKTQEAIEEAAVRLSQTRPTAVNLFWAIERMRKVAREQKGEAASIKQNLLLEAKRIHDEDLALCRSLGKHGAELVPDGATILTHCNAGALATAGWGTALGVIRSAAEAGKKVRILADETRPFLQGARLTAWELQRDGFDVTVIPDVAAPHLMSRKEVDLVVVGADRVAANGDVANKIGTYGVALAAKAAGVPFYVAAPWSTIDLETPTGAQIPIEERPDREVTHVGPTRIVPEGVKVRNPAFDVTLHELVTALITDRGVIRAPYTENLGAKA